MHHALCLIRWIGVTRSRPKAFYCFCGTHLATQLNLKRNTLCQIPHSLKIYSYLVLLQDGDENFYVDGTPRLTTDYLLTSRPSHFHSGLIQNLLKFNGSVSLIFFVTIINTNKNV